MTDSPDSNPNPNPDPDPDDEGFWGYDAETDEPFCRRCGHRWPSPAELLTDSVAHAATHQPGD